MSKPKETMPSTCFFTAMIDGVRQWCHPSEFRIGAPDPSRTEVEEDDTEVESPPIRDEAPDQSVGNRRSDAQTYRVVSILATCLWYLKTKHFKKAWRDDDVTDDDPRVRRALGRVNKSIDALRNAGFELQDPTNRRYPPGGEAMMKPIQFQPTPGLSFEVVTETVTPIIFKGDKLIQRAEVFVAVPVEDADPGALPEVSEPTDSTGDPREGRPPAEASPLMAGARASSQPSGEPESTTNSRVTMSSPAQPAEGTAGTSLGSGSEGCMGVESQRPPREPGS